jgi:hypothetical protein
MESIHPFLSQVDHVGIQTDNPKALFEFFTNIVGLPAAFPYVEYPYYTSGSVVLGNIFLEIMRFGALPANIQSQIPRYHILGFLCRPNMLINSLLELQRRKIPHSKLIPFFAPEATDANPVALWANIYLGRLLGENSWLHLFFAMTKNANPKPSLMRSRLLNVISLSIMARAFRNGMPVLTEYYRGHDAAKRSADWGALRQCKGGALGIEYAQEVVVAVAAQRRFYEAWSQLLQPATLDSDNRFYLEAGPVVRLVPEKRSGIQTLVLKISSISQAERFAHRMNISTITKDDSLVIKLPYTNGLSLELRERSLPLIHDPVWGRGGLDVRMGAN